MKRLFCNRLHLSKKLLAYLILFLFIISLIPLIIMSFYSVPVLDDYNFGRITYQEYLSNGTLSSFFSGAIKSTVYFYNEWQGFFSANFMASFQLFNININLYFISNLIAIFIFAFSNLFILHVLLKDYLHLKKYDEIIVGFPIVTLLMQFLPSIAEGFYWMDGSIALIVNCISILIVACLLKLNKTGKTYKSVVISIFAIFLALMICGTNLLTFITMMLIYMCGLFYSLKNKKRKFIVLIPILMIIYIAGIIISLIAPGNAVREDDLNGMPFVKAVLFAIYTSISYFGESFTLCVIAVIILILPILYRYLKSVNYSFKYPLLVFVLSYAVYSARFSVQLYAAGYVGSPRQYNQYYLGFIWLVFINLVYFIGWLAKNNKNNEYVNFEFIYDKLKNYSLVYVCIVAIVFSAGCISYGPTHLASVSTLKSIMSGEAKQYKEEMFARIEMYENPDIKNIAITPVSVLPESFVGDGISTDPDYWVNDGIERYYNKDSVVLEN